MPLSSSRDRNHTVTRGMVEDIAVKAAQGRLGEATVTATADGLTTGLIPVSAVFITAVSANADYIITLPSANGSMIGRKIRGYIGATGCEIRTPASSNETINNVDSDGTKEAAIPATTYFELACVASGAWILRAWDELGAVITAIVPD